MSDFHHALEVARDPDADLDLTARRAHRYGRGRSTDAGSEQDVAVDFPSPAKFPARMQALFFGREPRACGSGTAVVHTAAVSLSWRQARDGARVPVDVDVRHSCPVCGGRGEIWSDPCGVCAGTGSGTMSHRVRLRVPARVRHGARLVYTVALAFAAETRVELRVNVR